MYKWIIQIQEMCIPTFFAPRYNEIADEIEIRMAPINT